MPSKIPLKYISGKLHQGSKNVNCFLSGITIIPIIYYGNSLYCKIRLISASFE